MLQPATKVDNTNPRLSFYALVTLSSILYGLLVCMSYGCTRCSVVSSAHCFSVVAEQSTVPASLVIGDLPLYSCFNNTRCLERNEHITNFTGLAHRRTCKPRKYHKHTLNPRGSHVTYCMLEILFRHDITSYANSYDAVTGHSVFFSYRKGYQSHTNV